MMRLFFIACALVMLVSACSSSSIHAPVHTRGNQSATDTQLPPVRRQPARNSNYYTVQRGDTLYSIAWQYGLSYQQLAAMNAVHSPYTIYTGQKLRVRPSATPVTRPAPTRTTKPATPTPVKKSVTRAVPQAKTKTQISAYNGKWTWPTRGRVLSGFNPNEQGKKGIDIGGHEGQPVKAAAGGKVVYVGSGLVGYGRLIIIKHNQSLLSAYGHNSKLLVAEGEYVKAGQMIAKMGSSGTSRTELYFEVRKNGKPVNPLQYLPKS